MAHTHTHTKTHTHIHTHTQTHTHKDKQRHTHTHRQTHTDIQTHRRTRTHARTHAHASIYARTHARAHARTHARTLAHTHARTHTHTHTHLSMIIHPFRSTPHILMTSRNDDDVTLRWSNPWCVPSPIWAWPASLNSGTYSTTIQIGGGALLPATKTRGWIRKSKRTFHILQSYELRRLPPSFLIAPRYTEGLPLSLMQQMYTKTTLAGAANVYEDHLGWRCVDHFRGKLVVEGLRILLRPSYRCFHIDRLSR